MVAIKYVFVVLLQHAKHKSFTKVSYIYQPGTTAMVQNLGAPDGLQILCLES